jgi:hypothetical protein
MGQVARVRLDRPNDKEQRAFPDMTSMQWIESLARLLDSKFVIPGTGIRFGLDPIMSLFPVVGDLLTYLISGMMIHTMYQRGASRKVVIKMLLNSTLDAVIGAVPLVGTVFDVFYRSNNRNVKLLQEYYHEGKHQGSGKGILFLILVFVVIAIASLVFGVWKFFQWVF